MSKLITVELNIYRMSNVFLKMHLIKTANILWVHSDHLYLLFNEMQKELQRNVRIYFSHPLYKEPFTISLLHRIQF